MLVDPTNNEVIMSIMNDKTVSENKIYLDLISIFMLMNENNE